jgi:poly(A) polymerase
MKLFLEQKEASLLTKLSRFLSQENIDSYLVGGYVRDTLLGRPTRDVDIAVDALAPEAAKKVATTLKAKYVLLDKVNEIARVVFIEGDSAQGDRWHLDFSTIRGGIEANLSHRDFTINAMAVNLRELEEGHPRLIDPFQGKRDLDRGLIRVVRETAFQEDPARLLRAVRLAAEYSFNIEERTEALIQAQSQLICQVAGERVREELCRLLSARNAAYFLYYLDHLGLLTAIFPELAPTKGVEQPIEHFWDVFHHSVETVAAVERLLSTEGNEEEVLNLVPRSPTILQHFEEEVSGGVTRGTLLKLAALLHDIAKPQTRSLEPNGRARFLGHTKEGAIMAGSTLQRLRFSTRETKMVQKMIESHLRLWQMGGEGKPTSRAIYRFFRDTGDVSSDIIFLTLADFLATRGPNLDLEEWSQHCQLMDYILSQLEESCRQEREKEKVAPEKLIDGHDLINIFGLKPSPKIGELLEAVREAQGVGEIATREEALAFVRRKLVM